MLKARLAVTVFLSLIPLSYSVFAQPAPMDDCRAIRDRLARYACYDGVENGRVPTSSRPATSTPTSTSDASTSNASTSTASTSDESTFGRSASSDTSSVQEDEGRSGLPIIGRFFNRDRDEEEQAPEVVSSAGDSEVDSFGRGGPPDESRIIDGDEGKELIADISALEERNRNLWLITLANGQTWIQMESKPYRLQVGDSVRIYPTRWGNSYRLTSERMSGYIQVRRLN